MSEVKQTTKDRPLQSARVILCEGADEYDILCWLRKEQGLKESDVEIMNAHGRTNLATKLSDLPYESGGSDVKLVCVVLDAEARRASDQKLREKIRVEANNAGVKLLLIELPDDTNTGGLETLVRQTVNEQAQQYQCADRWEKCLSASADTNTQAQKDKAWAHVWLAGHGEIYSRLGFAFTSSASVRAELSQLHQRFDNILKQVLTAPLNASH